VTDLPKLPDDLVRALFNLHQGEEIDAYCGHCQDLTKQVKISYSQLSVPQRNQLKGLVGRVLDAVPGFRFVIGKPTLCRNCKTVNHP
jgi:hypothetical protein